MNNLTQNLAESIRTTWQNNNALHTGWLLERQQSALDIFTARGFPAPRDEDWKYTDITALTSVYPEWLGNSPTTIVDASHGRLEIADAINLIFIDGIFQPELSSSDLPAGLVAGPLQEFDAQTAESAAELLGSLASDEDSGFVALNTAFSNELTILTLADNTVLEQPIYICHQASTSELSSHPRLVAKLGNHSQARIIEHHTGSATSIINAVTEIHCGENATLSYCKLQENSHSSWHTASQYVYLERSAQVKCSTIDSGAAIGRNELRLSLAGPGAHAEATGLILADGNRHIDSRVHVEHIAPNTTSRERYRTVLADKARGVFNGKILVQKDAQKTAAELTNRNLLLNAGAEIDTKPELEIYADDVKCAHGSTTGQLDENSMFYLLSRGIAPLEARNLLVKAFVAELLNDMEFPAVTERMQSALQALRFRET